MNEIWHHINNPRLIASVILEKIEGDWHFESNFRPDLRIYIFVAALFAVGGALLLGMRIGGVNGMITSGSISIGLIVSTALFYVKRKNDAINQILTLESHKINQFLRNHRDQLQIVINHCDLEALRQIVSELTIFRDYNNCLLAACFGSNNPQIPGNVYDGVTWVGSKAQEICKVVFDLKCETRPDSDLLFERFFALKYALGAERAETLEHFQKFPNDVQKFIDKMSLEQIDGLASNFWSLTWSENPINDDERRIFKGIYYINSPLIRGDSFSQIIANISPIILAQSTLPPSLVSLICGYYSISPDEIPKSSKLAIVRQSIQATCRVEVHDYFDQRLREALSTV